MGKKHKGHIKKPGNTEGMTSFSLLQIISERTSRISRQVFCSCCSGWYFLIFVTLTDSINNLLQLQEANYNSQLLGSNNTGLHTDHTHKNPQIDQCDLDISLLHTHVCLHQPNRQSLTTNHNPTSFYLYYIALSYFSLRWETKGRLAVYKINLQST